MSRGRALGPGRLWKYRGAWHLDYSDEHGQRRRKRLGTDRRAAELARSELVHRRDMALLGLGLAVGRELRLSEILAPYLGDLAVRTGKHHTRNVRQRLGQFIAELGDPRVKDLRPVEVIQLRNRAAQDGKAPRTANLLVDRLHAMLVWAISVGLVDTNPIARVKRLPDKGKHARRKRRALSEVEIVRFLTAAEEDDRYQAERFAICGRSDPCVQAALRVVGRPVRVPQAPLWQFLLETGARYGEATRIVWGDIDLDRQLVVLRDEITKSGRQRTIPLRPVMCGRLVELRQAQGQVFCRQVEAGDPVFLSPAARRWPWHTGSIKPAFDRLIGKAGIEKRDSEGRQVDVHALRHTFASRLARSGVGLVQAQRLMGHSDPRLTAVAYTHLGVDELRAAIDLLPATDSAIPERIRDAT